MLQPTVPQFPPRTSPSKNPSHFWRATPIALFVPPLFEKKVIMPTSSDDNEAPLPPVPSLPEPVYRYTIKQEGDELPPPDDAAAEAAIAAEAIHAEVIAAEEAMASAETIAAASITAEAITAALADDECEEEDPMNDVDDDDDECDPDVKLEVGEDGLPKKKKRRNKKLPLTYHEAIAYFARGIYVDIESGHLRCSCNHKPCDKWDSYGYTRHFTFKCHRKYETERLDEAEMTRLKDARDTYMRMNPIVEEQTLRKKRKLREGEKLLTVEELRVQESHWMAMWKDASAELRQLRLDLKNEEDPDVRGELMADIEGLKKRKGDWSKLLGLSDSPDINITNV